MSVSIPHDDPAEHLLLRAAPTDLEKFWDLMDRVPVPVGAIASRLGIKVLSLTMDSNLSGLIRRDANRTFEIHINNIEPSVRQRFTVCHEIAHFLLHRKYIDGDGITDNIMYRSQLSNSQEAEANKVGAALLLPWKSVKDWHRNQFSKDVDRSNLKAIGQAFRASELAVGFRFNL